MNSLLGVLFSLFGVLFGLFGVLFGLLGVLFGLLGAPLSLFSGVFDEFGHRFSHGDEESPFWRDDGLFLRPNVRLQFP